MRKITLLLILAGAYMSPSFAAVTPTDVYHQATLINTQINALKKANAPNFQPRVPGIQLGKTPLHVYGKSLELMEKIQRYQVQHQLPQLTLPQLPSKRVKPKSVLKLLEQTQVQLDSILRANNIAVDLTAIKAQTKSRTPSDVYEKIWQASFAMDALVAAIKPADVMRNAHMIEAALVQVAERRGRKMSLPAIQQFSGKKPADVTLQLHKLLYRLAKLERKLKLKPLIVPAFPAGKIKPEDAYDVTGNVLADLTRIAIKLKIPAVERQPVPSGKITPNNVYAQIVRLNAGAQQLID
ncbi:MAG: hypothetical protein ACPG4U_11275 [Pseudomonadales bacterium]